MPSTRQRTTLRKRNLRNGALLVASEAAKLVNIPLAQDAARHIKQVLVALKPSVLQAPKTNDLHVQDLANHVGRLIGVLNRAVQQLDNSGLAMATSNEDIMVELRQLHTHLSKTFTELQELQQPSYVTKLASQGEIRERTLQLKERLSSTINDLTLRLLVAVLTFGSQSQLVTARRFDSAACKYSALERKHHSLVRRYNVLALKIVDIPLAQDVAGHIRHVVASLESSTQQTPRTNDSDAQHLANRIENLLKALDVAIQHLQHSAALQAGTYEYMAIEIRQLRSHLVDFHTELDNIRLSPYSTKLVSQTRIQERIIQLKEELYHVTVDATLRLLDIVLAFSARAQSQPKMVQDPNSTATVAARDYRGLARDHRALGRKHEALAAKHRGLARDIRRRQHLSNKRIRILEGDCKGLTHHANAVLVVHRIDKQRITYLVLLNAVYLFFLDTREPKPF